MRVRPNSTRRRAACSYTPVSEEPSEALEFHMKLRPTGEMSGALRAAPVGFALTLCGPHGPSLMCPSSPDRVWSALLMVVGGITVNRVLSVIKYTLSCAPRAGAGRMVLVWCVSREEDLCVLDELRALAGASARRLTVHAVLSRPSSTWRGECGRVTEALLERLLADPAAVTEGTPGAGGESGGGAGGDLSVIVAGPDAMRANAVRCLVAVGCGRRARVRCFHVNPAPAGTPSPRSLT